MKLKNAVSKIKSGEAFSILNVGEIQNVQDHGDGTMKIRSGGKVRVVPDNISVAPSKRGAIVKSK